MDKKTGIRTCPHCDCEFKIYRNQVYCSLQCALWSRVDIRSPDECWLWTGRDFNRKGGYGQFSFRGKRYRVHRTALDLTHGLPDGKKALHSCDTPGCANPHHLRPGTQRDNVHDMRSRGKKGHEFLCGDRNLNAKLTNGQVAEVRSLLTAGKTPVEIAAEFGVRAAVIREIRRHKTYKCVGTSPNIDVNETCMAEN